MAAWDRSGADRRTTLSTSLAPGVTLRRRRRGRFGRAGLAGGTVTARRLQVALGCLWLLDGALQLQPFMLGTGFAHEVLAPAAAGQPSLVAVPARWAADVIAAHPVAWDVPFATVQILLGAGMLLLRNVRPVLAASVAWALGVWFFGEGLSGLPTGHASLLSGAPGAVLLYAVLALAAWPRNGRSDEPPASWLPLAWATLWIGAALLQALPPNASGAAVAGTLRANGAPRVLAGLQSSLAGWIATHGTSAVIGLVVAEALIGLASLERRTVRLGAGAGLLLCLAIWAIGQNFGGLYTGRATDPNTAPLLALTAVALLGGWCSRPSAPNGRASRG